ncbi:MAG: NAD(P)-binding protein, partial [Caldimonas sp.]
MAGPDIKAGRLPAEQYGKNFGDAHPPLTHVQALIEAERCYYCYDAPCVTACPTGIDIPSFVRRIGENNLRGAARAILEANVFGGMCARVCPTEVLCEQACVRNTNEDKPVEIGLLQRHATDAYFKAPGAPMFTRASATGRRIAVVGAGPAGLSCAHRAAMLGHEVTVFEALTKPGGLNEYGLATYKTTDNFAQQEIDWLL